MCVCVCVYARARVVCSCVNMQSYILLLSFPIVDLPPCPPRGVSEWPLGTTVIWPESWMALAPSPPLQPSRVAPWGLSRCCTRFLSALCISSSLGESIRSADEAALTSEQLATSYLLVPIPREAGIWPFCSGRGLVPLGLRTLDTNQPCSCVDMIA